MTFAIALFDGWQFTVRGAVSIEEYASIAVFFEVQRRAVLV
jgi:hypothetical protein